MTTSKEFCKKLMKLINEEGLENVSNTPDFLLAEFLLNCLQAYSLTVCARDRWYGDGVCSVTGTDNPQPVKVSTK